MCNNMGFHGNGCNNGLRHIEQIALNKGAIDCLNGRVCRNEKDIRDRYTKAELDRMLAGKMDKCGSLRPSCNGNGKPNICDFYTKEELDNLLAELACKCDGYSKEELDNLLAKIACNCDCYSKAEIDSLLENKVNGDWTVYTSLNELGITPGTETIISIIGAMKDNSELHYIVSDPGAAGIYPTVNGVHVVGLVDVIKLHEQVTEFYYTQAGTYSGSTPEGFKWIGNYIPTSSGWSGWKRLATTEPPQEYELILLNDITAPYQSIYRKSQDNIVTVSITASASSGAMTNDQQIGLLPEGFRPKESTVMTTSNLAGISGMFIVNPNGGIYWIGSDLISPVYAVGFVSFAAK